MDQKNGVESEREREGTLIEMSPFWNKYGNESRKGRRGDNERAGEIIEGGTMGAGNASISE